MRYEIWDMRYEIWDMRELEQVRDQAGVIALLLLLGGFCKSAHVRPGY